MRLLSSKLRERLLSVSQIAQEIKVIVSYTS